MTRIEPFGAPLAQLKRDQGMPARRIHFAGEAAKPDTTPAKPEQSYEAQINSAYQKAKNAWMFKGHAYKKAADLVIKMLDAKAEPSKALTTTIFLIVNEMVDKKVHVDKAQEITTRLLDADEPRIAWRARHTAYRMRMNITEKVSARADKLLAKFSDGSANERDKEDAALTSEFMIDQRIEYPKALQLFSKGK